MSSLFIQSCLGNRTSPRPVWLMRQAGRYMKEYRDVREKVSFLDLCKTPELACKVTVDAVRILRADAAIIFADILLITEPLGLDLEFIEGRGPVLHNPIRTPKDVDNLYEVNAEDSLGFVGEAIHQTNVELNHEIPVIGFAGAPFTVAAYMVEGGSSRQFAHVKAFMKNHPASWNALMEKLTRGTLAYLQNQISRGAAAVQLFDSWIGCLSERDYREFIQPHMIRLFANLPKNIPSIYFGTNTHHLFSAMSECGSNVMGVDFQTPLSYANKIAPHQALQGNLDPTLLLCEWEVVKKEALRVLDDAKDLRGFIFNLGHGILPQTPVENVIRLIDLVHETTKD